MIDSILYIALGLAVTVMSVWGGIVSAKSLPSSENRWLHITGFIGIGIVAFILTVWVGIRNYSAQKNAATEQNELQTSLENDGKLLAETKANLDNTRIDEATMKGQLQMLGPMLAAIHGDETARSTNESSALSKIGNALEESPLLIHPTGSRYELLKSSDLKTQALNIAQGIRNLAYQADMLTSQLFHQKGLSGQFNQQTWDADVQKEIEIDTQFNRNYDSGYKSEAILLKDELMRREAVVPDPKKILYLNTMYDHPTNSIGAREVADDLERLAKSLPDSSTKQHSL